MAYCELPFGGVSKSRDTRSSSAYKVQKGAGTGDGYHRALTKANPRKWPKPLQKQLGAGTPGRPMATSSGVGSDRDTSPPQGPSALPLELWHQILASFSGPHPAEDILCKDPMDVHSLQACSLTCRAWLPIAHEHLFRYLGLLVTSANCEDAVIAVMESLPAIGKYVRVLSIGLSFLESRFVRQTDVLTHFRPVAPMVPNVNSLVLARITLQAPPDNMPPFTALFPSLHSLYIGSIQPELPVLHTYLTACQGLRELTLLGVLYYELNFLSMVVRASPNNGINIAPAPPEISETHMATVLDWMTPTEPSAPIILDTLETSCSSPYEQRALATFVGDEAVHVKGLDIGFHLSEKRIDRALRNLLPFSSQYVETLNIRFPQVDYGSTQAIIRHILGTIDMPALKTLSIVYSVRRTSTFVAAQPDYDLSRLPALKAANLTISNAKRGMSDAERLAMTTVTAFLASAHKRGILNVTVFEDAAT
ncbi:uncharacterized protein C8Q71DRAFT_862890 [Rhodofomes roseus]|uniref:F-box domain-containing protein n=1 Tax=Rhodofomes roseus TaxID=34475 RepID=A0ABQ8K069_9APHY|nr:uncharacterized protein C8Q71DRAFT_862890 [Rhodofomes roseus]KAH9830033.1 hypothetical protein C8Q71DRAFT_862890 [Rhodofomes roseus]